MSNYRLFGEWALLFLASALLVVFSLQNQWTQRADAMLLDFAMEWRAQTADDRIVIVEIDDRSLAEVGNWPWDRSRHADLVRKLSTASPELVVFDILFLEPTGPASDDDLANAIMESDRTLLPHTFTGKAGTYGEMTAVLPITQLAAASMAMGHVAVFPDPDGVVRRYNPIVSADGRQWPHLAISTAGLMGIENAETVSPAQVPITTMLPSGAFRTVSAGDVIAGRTPADFIDGKIVIIGATAQGLGDRYSVPEYAGRIMAGAEIQANFLNATINQELVQPFNIQWVGIWLVICIACVFIALWKLPPTWALRACVAMTLAIIAISILAVVVAGVWIPVASAVLSILIAYPLWGWRRLSSVSRFLEDEAATLTGLSRTETGVERSGFDTVAQQVSVVRSLIGETTERLAFLRGVLGASPDPMLVFDGEGSLTLMNARAEGLFGALGALRGLTLLDLVAEQNAQLDFNKGELTLQDGRVFLVANADVGLGEGNEIFALRDISVIRETEKQRTEMLEFLSHDMRSPQVAIIGLTGSSGSSLEKSERLGRIENQARRTLKLTEDFVQIARLDYEGIQREETDISALLHEALDRAYPQAKRKHIQLQSSVPEDPEFCEVDPFALSRAIDNLLTNAIKFSPDSSAVDLTLSRADSGSIDIEVCDHGPGLPKERMRDTFARFGAHDRHAGPSAGLGLAFVKKVVDQHGGSIEVESSSDKGTRFILCIPCPKGCTVTR